MSSLVRSSAAGDAKLKLIGAALTDVSALEEVEGGGSPLAADEAAACSCLFFSWNLAARSLSRWIFLDERLRVGKPPL